MPLGTRVVTDLRPLEADMKDLQTRNASQKAVKAGIAVVQPAVKGNAPTAYGHLKKAQGTKVKKGRRGKTGAFALQGAKTSYKKARKKKGKTATALAQAIPALYDHLVMGGVKSHGVGKGGAVVSTPHPGAKANPYRRRAYESVKGQVGAAMLKAYGEELKKLIAKNAAKLARKGNRGSRR